MVAAGDLARDPTVVAGLAAARLGEAAFRRELSLVDDDGFDAPALLPGWTRRHLVAHVGYNALALARLVTWAGTGVEHPMYTSAQARAAEIDAGARLRPPALRDLADQGSAELDVRWRGLPDDRWQARVRTAQGRLVPVAETLWMRQREVWLHAVDLATGLRTSDIPPEFLRRLLGDVLGAWRSRGEEVAVRLVAEDDGSTWGDPRADVVARGALPQLVVWATGRGEGDLRWSGGSPRSAPRWL